MKPEKQRIAILEAMGWIETEPWLNGRRCFERADSNAGWGLDDLPDYLNDLNAMHEAEKMLDDLQGCIFADKLFRILNSSDGVSEFMKIRATAAQRAEAFLRTIGKWEES